MTHKSSTGFFGQNKGLLLVSLFIILSDVLFIAINYSASLQGMREETKLWAYEAKQGFTLGLDSKGTSMQQIATYVANMPDVQRLFRDGRLAARQSGASNNAQLAVTRNRLYQYVRPGWEKLTSQWDVRQLHFHLGPGSTSFLRVHRPRKFGDNMDTVRYTVVDVNKLHKPVRGFETGRVYTGIRGVVPVFATDSKGHKVHVGALEAGTSFTHLTGIIKSALVSEVTVLLKEDHVRSNMWPDFIEKHFRKQDKVGAYFIEESTAKDPSSFLNRPQVLELLGQGYGTRFITDNGIWQVCIFELRDYRGTVRKDLPAAARVVLWRDASAMWAQFKQNLTTNILFSVFALLIIETILILGWRFSKKRLQDIIDDQTRELKTLAVTDPLTGVLNHGCIEETLAAEFGRAQRYDEKFSVIMLDVDHFKAVNDQFGHLIGDEVLKELTRRVEQLTRTPDRLGRWGGEEFILIAPQTDHDQGIKLAERIRKTVCATPMGEAGIVTVSLGVTQNQSDDTPETLITRADQAMYQAKHDGRNRTVSA